MNDQKLDSYRFLRGITRRMVKTWIKMESPREIPWTELQTPLEDSCVALISTGGIHLKTDPPFDQQGERENPWWGDPSYRMIPAGTKADQISISHLHINPVFALQDLNCLLPLERLQELAEIGLIGAAAPRHYSIMGYILDPEQLLMETVPQLVNSLAEDQVNAVVLVPA